MSKAIVSLSGGMDSATVLAMALETHRLRNEVHAVSFRYGSKHNKWENEAAANIANHYKVPFQLIQLDEVMAGFKSALLKSGGDIPEGHYESESMSQTVVPGRNIIFASILTGIAWSRDAKEVWMGMHSGDHAIYEDCRPEFFYSMNAAVACGTGNRVHLVAPFLYGNKKTILHSGTGLNVPYNLTRTCYKDQETACGKCGSCCERKEAWKNIGIKDPIEYEYDGPMPEKKD